MHGEKEATANEDMTQRDEMDLVEERKEFNVTANIETKLLVLLVDLLHISINPKKFIFIYF